MSCRLALTSAYRVRLEETTPLIFRSLFNLTMKDFCSPRLLCVLVVSGLCSALASAQHQWELVETNGKPTARHEATLIGFDNQLFLIGGRRVNPVDVFDPRTNSWSAKSKTPMELHHFQAVVVEDRIYLMGAMTGRFPKETPLEKVVVYLPKTDTFEFVHSIPESRRRGGAGAVLHKGKIYLVGGITNGHIDGCQAWLDEYDPATGQWRVLPDAPHARDHFQAVVVGNRLYAPAGRSTSQKTKKLFELTVSEMDVFDFDTETWVDAADVPPLPTPRAGNSALVVDGRIVVAGGESGNQKMAHNEVDAYDPRTNAWSSWPKLNRGRHGTGLVVVGDYLYTASGCGNRGGNPELDTVERLSLKK